jgi:hypothetical protein
MITVVGCLQSGTTEKAAIELRELRVPVLRSAP